jgi:hypothetical protein
MEGSGSAGPRTPPAGRGGPLYFFPDRDVTAEELKRILAGGTPEERAWAISHLLRYAQWDDIWSYVSRDEVREVFAALDLPDNLRQAWGRMLKVEEPVSSG